MKNEEAEKYNLTLAEGVSTLSILHGDHKHPEDTRKRIEINGTITAPGIYVDHLRKHKMLDTKDPVVFVDMEALTISYRSNPRDTYGEVVSGKMQYNTETQKIGINGTKRYTLEEFKQFVKQNRLMFPNETQHAVLLTSINNFKAKLQKEIEVTNDNRGNKNNINNSVLDTDVPFDFNISLQIFKDGPTQTVHVEICLDASDSGGVRFWFESSEYKEAIDTQKEAMMGDQIAKFESLNIIYI